MLFLDADCIAAPDLVERLVARHRDGATVVGGSVAMEANKYWIMCDNLLVFAPVLSSEPAGLRADLPSLNFSIARQLFVDMGGFDERFPYAAGEDTDLCLRLRRKGYTNDFEPSAAIRHRPQRSSARAVWNHLRMFGRVHYDLQERYPDLLPSLLARIDPRLAGVLIALAPLLATLDILLLFARQPALRRYPLAYFGMVWGKIGWYIGAAEMIMLRPTHALAEQRS